MTRTFLLLTLFAVLATPAWGKLTLGVVPSPSSVIQDKSQAKKFAEYLQAGLHEPVSLRIFNSEPLLHQWLNHYREVDLAIISETLFDSQRQGEFYLLTNYLPGPESNIQTGVLVGRRGLSPARRQQLTDLLMVMDTDQAALSLLRSMHVASFGTPGAMVELAPAGLPAARHDIQSQVSPPPVKALVSAEKNPPPEPAAVRPQEPSPVPRSAPKNAPAPILDEKEPGIAGTHREEGSGEHSRETASEEVTSSLPAPGTGDRPSQRPGAAAERYSRQASHQASVLPSRKREGRHYRILIVAILLCGMLVKLILLYQRRPRRRPITPAPQLLMQHDWRELHSDSPAGRAPQTGVLRPAPAAREEMTAPLQEQAEACLLSSNPEDPATQPAEDAATRPAGVPAGRLQLDGKLGPRQIPALLQLISASRQSGTLQVSSRKNEKRIIFNEGRISSVGSLNPDNQNQTGFLMNKLGYLLIREGKITEDQRDQALVMCEGDAGLRMGEALLRMGALENRDLLESLRYQAKMVLHSLVVFPEGIFEFIPGTVAIPEKDDLNLGVDDFLKEAAAHQGEWRNIREMIPSLDTVLEFAPNGHDKVNNGRMTVHQKFVLSMIDGRRPIREICVAATMLDYELYRFLYLMTKAGILRRAGAAGHQAVAWSGREK